MEKIVKIILGQGFRNYLKLSKKIRINFGNRRRT